MTTDIRAFTVFLIILVAAMFAFAHNIDDGMERVQCGPTGQGGKICTYPNDQETRHG